VPYLLLGLVDLTFLTLVGAVGFGVPFRGSVLDFFLLGLVFIYANLGLGLLVAGFTRTQHAAMVSTFFIFAIPPLFLSDVFFPVASMVTWLQRVSYMLPATHFTRIARGVFLKGIGLGVLWPNALFLLALGSISGLVSYLRFKKRLD
jgi:ABC-2 type transport system permease protein